MTAKASVILHHLPPKKGRGDQLRDTFAQDERHNSSSISACKDTWADLVARVQNEIAIQVKPCIEEVQRWIHDSHHSRWHNDHCYSEQLPALFLSIGCVDWSDHAAVMDTVEQDLKRQPCHVASIQPSYLKGMNSSVTLSRTLMHRFLGWQPEVADVDVLAAWHDGAPLLVVVRHVEACDREVLGNMVRLLGEWRRRVPLLLLMSGGTSGQALGNVLPSTLLGRLQLQHIKLGKPREHLEGALRVALLDGRATFSLGSSAAAFVQSFMQQHDCSISSLLRALHVLHVQHFIDQPLSWLVHHSASANSQEEMEAKCLSLETATVLRAAALPSFLEAGVEGDRMQLGRALWHSREMMKLHTITFQWLSAAAAPLGDLLSLLSMIGQPKFLEPARPGDHVPSLAKICSLIQHMSEEEAAKLLEQWQALAKHKEMQGQLQVMRNAKEVAVQRKSAVRAHVGHSAVLRRRMQLESASSTAASSETLQERMVSLLHRVVHLHLCPAKKPPAWELSFLEAPASLCQVLAAPVRSKVLRDLSMPQEGLDCSCCSGGGLCSTAPAPCIAYTLCCQHSSQGTFVVADWFREFVNIVGPAPSCSPAAGIDELKESRLNSSVEQARFVQAAAELQEANAVRIKLRQRSLLGTLVQALMPTALS